MHTEPELLDNAKHLQAARVTLQPAYRDSTTGALWVHKDLDLAMKPWEVESHIGPPEADEKFGDVESWAAYVRKFGGGPDFAPFLTWNNVGLHAVIDYHSNTEDAGRMQWLAGAPFKKTLQWISWMEFANGRSKSQREAVEALEDFGADIIDPDQASLMGILRSLRASVAATATSELEPDGGSFVTYTNQKQVRSGTQTGDVKLPPELTIQIPVLKGHVTADGSPVAYKLKVRMRVNVAEDGHLQFRFTIPKAEIVLEDVYANRVKAAQDALDGTGYTILRAASV